MPSDPRSNLARSPVLAARLWAAASLCEAMCACGELDSALQRAGQNGSASYIEIVTDEFAAPPLPQKLHDSRDTLYAH